MKYDVKIHIGESTCDNSADHVGATLEQCPLVQKQEVNRLCFLSLFHA